MRPIPKAFGIAAGYELRWPHRLQAYVPKKIAAARKILDHRLK
jgi:hypothetical protein